MKKKKKTPVNSSTKIHFRLFKFKWVTTNLTSKIFDG